MRRCASLRPPWLTQLLPPPYLAGKHYASPAPPDAALRKFASALDDAIATAALLDR